MNDAPASILEELPGELMIWVLIISELLVFGAGLLAFLGVRATDPTGFATDQDSLNRAAGALNTIVLVTSGYFAARAAQAASHSVQSTRGWLAATSVLGVVFLSTKLVEYSEKAHQGIGIESSEFFTFYYLLTGFHAMHVLAGLAIFALLARRPGQGPVQAGVAFWHMVDLVWVLLFPIMYLVR